VTREKENGPKEIFRKGKWRKEESEEGEGSEARKIDKFSYQHLFFHFQPGCRSGL